MSSLSRRSSDISTLDNVSKPAPIFWPRDLLPRECPNSRIIMYGYDTKVTKHMTGATNKNSIFSHAKDLLHALRRSRKVDRPLIFVAHSLGGIIVKEMLAISSTSTEKELRDIVGSTASVIFLGTPHRGSPIAALGGLARILVSAIGMETNSAILDALGLRTSDLERAQEAFSGLWRKYNFRVKTFQEGLGLTGVNLGIFGNKVVPDYSSLIGDVRENAETIQANHMEMCRFTGMDDRNYLKVSGEIGMTYTSITQFGNKTRHASRQDSSFSASPSGSLLESETDELDEAEAACLQSLRFPSMNLRRQVLEKPDAGTGRWLFEHKTYQDWFSDRNQDVSCGLIWLKGKPGSGKSTLLKEAFLQASRDQTESDYWTLAFFFNAKGDELEHSPLGLLRSLLYQLFTRSREHFARFLKYKQQRKSDVTDNGKEDTPWDETELKSAFQAVFEIEATRRTIIYIDAVDECSSSVRSQILFWRELTKTVYSAGGRLSVCLSSRHFPYVAIGDCPEIIVDQHNEQDIITYVDRKLDRSMSTGEPERELLRDKIIKKSAGVFLWAVLVLDKEDKVLQMRDQGKGLRYLLKELDNVPAALENLFTKMLSDLEPTARQTTVLLFQWATLAVKPLRLHEWHNVMAFIGNTTPSSLDDWKKSEEFIESDDQLEYASLSIAYLLSILGWSKKKSAP